MVVALIGESCTGKSTLAEGLKTALSATVYAGKDFLRMAKSEPDARRAFSQLLAERAEGGDTVVYVITEPEHLTLLPEKAVRVLVTAGIESIKARFAARMNGKLPPPLAAMLEKKHGMFDRTPHVLRINTDEQAADASIAQILQLCKAEGLYGA